MTFALPRIDRREHEAILLAGIRSRDLIYSRYFDPTMNGTLDGLCYLACEMVHYFNPRYYRLALLSRHPHYFLVGKNKEIVDLTARSLLPVTYKNRKPLLPWKPLSKRGKIFLARVREQLATLSKG